MGHKITVRFVMGEASVCGLLNIQPGSGCPLLGSCPMCSPWTGRPPPLYCFLKHLTHRYCGCWGGLSGRGWPLWDGHIRSSSAVCGAVGLQAPPTSPRDVRSSHFSSSLNTTLLGRWESYITWKAPLQYVTYCWLSIRMELVNFSEMDAVFTLLFLKKS